MKIRLVLLASLLALSPWATAQLYKWVDKDGKTVYSDQPPPNQDSRQLRLQSGTTAPTGTATATAAPKGFLERDKELEKTRKESREQGKKAEQTAKAAQDAEERCAAARSNLKVFEDGGRILKRSASGERVFLEDQEVETERQKARAAVDEHCKKS